MQREHNSQICPNWSIDCLCKSQKAKACAWNYSVIARDSPFENENHIHEQKGVNGRSKNVMHSPYLLKHRQKMNIFQRKIEISLMKKMSRIFENLFRNRERSESVEVTEESDATFENSDLRLDPFF